MPKRSTRSVALGVGFAVFVPLAGCPSSQPARPAAQEIAQAVCDAAFRCCARNEMDYYLGPFVETDNCADRIVHAASLAEASVIGPGNILEGIVTLPNLAVLDHAIVEGRTAVRSHELDACLEHLKTLQCGAFKPPDPPPALDVCVPPAEPPEISTPCEMDLLFEGHGQEGDDCFTPGLKLECREGLVCRGIGTLVAEGACLFPGEEGEVCFSDGECQEDLYCSQLDGACRRWAQEGETCLFSDREDDAPSQATLLLRCDKGLACDPVTDACVAPCQRGFACISDNECDKQGQNLTCILGRCDLPRALGLPCDDNSHCSEGLRCQPSPAEPGKVCAPKLMNNEACQFGAHDDCASGFCDPSTTACAPQVSPGSLCETGLNEQCQGGYCQIDNPPVFCSVATQTTDCIGSQVCNPFTFVCESYCVGRHADGASCTVGNECLSKACVASHCAKPPLDDGAPCDSGNQCRSAFCSNDPEPVCATPPLANGRGCAAGADCTSGVCFESVCTEGLGEGAVCGDLDQPGCGLDFFCDPEAQPRPVCARIHEVGEPCTNDAQCRGSCVIRHARNVCDATPPREAVFCDGSRPAAPPMSSE
jgi:hypothetical protein